MKLITFTVNSDIIFKRDGEKLPSKDGSRKTRKKLQTNKPHWNDELSTL